VTNAKDMLIRVIERRAQRCVGQLSCQMVRAAEADRENVLDEMQFQRWLAETCRDCLYGS
jgi:hypothetical protein